MIHLHSLLRYAVLALLLITFIKSLVGWLKKNEYNAGDAKLAIVQMIFVQTQFLLGIALYFTEGWATAPFAEAMKNDSSRFWKVEHIAGMILAVGLVEIGRIRTKKLKVDFKKHRNAAIFYGIALIIIIKMIPWEAGRLF